MTQQELTEIVARNLVIYRKHNNITQLALAEKLNYSDKAVSKWERGESLPDLYVLKMIADFYGITVNDLMSTRSKPKMSLSKLKAFFIPIMSLCIVWLVALIGFFIWTLIDKFNPNHYLCFIIALPITFIVLLVFSGVFHSLIAQAINVSCVIWSTILALHLCLRSLIESAILLYYVGIPIQICTIAWYVYKGILKYKAKKQTENKPPIKE